MHNDDGGVFGGAYGGCAQLSSQDGRNPRNATLGKETIAVNIKVRKDILNMKYTYQVYT